MEGTQKFLEYLITKQGLNKALAKPLLEMVDPPVYGKGNPSFRDFMAPGLILGITYALAIGLTAISFVIERKEGLFDRSLVAGVKPYQMYYILNSQLQLVTLN